METLGGAWGRSATEDKFHYFEQAIFQVAQKPDESNDSYVARHDAYFKELITRKVKLEEIRAYILLKRVVVAAQVELKASTPGLTTPPRAPESWKLQQC